MTTRCNKCGAISNGFGTLDPRSEGITENVRVVGAVIARSAIHAEGSGHREFQLMRGVRSIGMYTINADNLTGTMPTIEDAEIALKVVNCVSSTHSIKRSV